MSRPFRGAILAAAVLLAAGCSSRKVTADGASAVDSKCTRCHGGVESSGGAPPRSVKGESATTARAVGAHTAHVNGGAHLAPALACDACHVAPDPAAPMAHVDGRVAVSFGVLAKANGVAAAWNPEAATCTVYCHGASMAAAGGDAKPPVWTKVDGTQADCGSCHGAPPPAPHPQRTDCARCHPGSMTLAGAATAPARHLDGTLDLELGCTSCHGDDTRAGSAHLKAAPPVSSTGATATTDRGVGAHQAHVNAGPLAKAIGCETCHVVPTDPAHPDGSVQLAFTGVANAAGPAASWNGATCATYCHGTTLSGGTDKAPAWTQVDGTQAACGTCHGKPPAISPHTPGMTNCRICHPGTVNADGTINVANGMHVNGEVDFQKVHATGWVSPTVHGYAANANLASCKECHGADLAGGETGVSCNTCHSAGTTAWQSDCTFCHGEPNRATNKAAPPVGTQGELATSATAVGAHQAHLVAGKVAGPVACTECHAVPTGLAHVNGTAQLTWGGVATAGGATPSFTAQGTCASTWCHGGKLGGGANTTPLWTKVDGSQGSCGTCHGLPPPSPHPQLATCQACHPETITSGFAIDIAGGKHVNGVVDVQTYHPSGWAPPSVHGLAANANLSSCKTCHGSDLAGGTAGISCSACHPAGWQTNCSFCHGDATRAGTSLLKAAPPQGSQDETATSARAVGAHQAHVTAGTLSGAIGCAACHTVPANLDHVNGTAAVAFSGLSNSDGVTSAWNGATCATYCHGTSLAGGANKAPAWTTVNGTQAACGACHGVAPPSPHPQNASCGKCHGGYTSGTVNLASHVNGSLELDALSCSSCHGDPARAGTELQKSAPPADTTGATATTARGVGAHAAHVNGSRWSNGFACTECHTIPGQLVHADGVVNMAFGPIANATDGNSPITNTTWNGNTCATSWCHGAGRANGNSQVFDGTNETPVWTGGAAQADCGTCHAGTQALRTPGSIHYTHRTAACSDCHGAGYGEAAVNRTTHVNGTIEYKSCDALECHGGG